MRFLTMDKEENKDRPEEKDNESVTLPDDGKPDEKKSDAGSVRNPSGISCGTIDSVKDENKDNEEEKVIDDESKTFQADNQTGTPDKPKAVAGGGSNPTEPPKEKETKNSKKPPQNKKRARKKGEDQKDDKNN